MAGMFDGVTTERLHRHGCEAMRALLAGNRFRCRRFLLEVSRRSVPFAGLDLVAEAMARTCGTAFPQHAHALRQVVHSALDSIGVVAVAGSFYAYYAGSEPALVLAEAEHMIESAPAQWISDLVGTRIIPALVDANSPAAWRGLVPWAEAEDPWRRRAVAAGTARVLCDPTSDTHDPVRLLDTLRRDASREVRGGVAQALRTLARHHPEVALLTMHTWARQADDRTATVVRSGMAGLCGSERRRLEAVLTAR